MELQNTKVLEKEALIFACVWNRNRIIITADTVDKANAILDEVRFYFPAYRQSLICGDFPKGERYKKGAKLIEVKEIASLRVAFKQSLDEEELGAPPVQILYFSSGSNEFQNILRYLDRGWITTSKSAKADIEKSFKIFGEIEYHGGSLNVIDPLPKDTFIEKVILEKTKFSGKSVKNYQVQMKASEVHHSFKAIMDEVETGKQLTQPFLSEALNIREKTIKKVIEIGKRERRLDLQNYIEETPTHLVNFLKKMSVFKELSLIAVFDSDQLMGYARYRDFIPPSQNFLQLKDEVKNLLKISPDFDKPWFFEINGKYKNILLYFYKYFFCFVIEKGLKLDLFRRKIEEHIKNLNGNK